MAQATIIKGPHVMWTSNRAHHGIKVQNLETPEQLKISGHCKTWLINAQQFCKVDHSDFLGISKEEQEQIRAELTALENAASNAMTSKI